MPEMQETRVTDFGWFNYANSYLRAAQALSREKLRTTHPEDPVCFLYYHSIELFLKSYLLLKGATEKNLKEWGHNVATLGAECRGQGLPLDDSDAEVFNLISCDDNLLKARYLKTGYFRRARVEALENTASHLHSEVRIALKEAGRSVR